MIRLDCQMMSVMSEKMLDVKDMQKMLNKVNKQQKRLNFQDWWGKEMRSFDRSEQMVPTNYQKYRNDPDQSIDSSVARTYIGALN